MGLGAVLPLEEQRCLARRVVGAWLVTDLVWTLAKYQLVLLVQSWRVMHCTNDVLQCLRLIELL